MIYSPVWLVTETVPLPSSFCRPFYSHCTKGFMVIIIFSWHNMFYNQRVITVSQRNTQQKRAVSEPLPPSVCVPLTCARSSQAWPGKISHRINEMHLLIDGHPPSRFMVNCHTVYTQWFPCIDRLAPLMPDPCRPFAVTIRRMSSSTHGAGRTRQVE